MRGPWPMALVFAAGEKACAGCSRWSRNGGARRFLVGVRQVHSRDRLGFAQRSKPGCGPGFSSAQRALRNQWVEDWEAVQQ